MVLKTLSFIVRQHQVLQVALWLTTNNTYFKYVEIDRDAINCLADNGIPNGLRFVLDTEISPHEDEDEGATSGACSRQ